MYRVDDYYAQLKSLLPQGLIWGILPDSNLGKLLRALACEYQRIDAAIHNLVSESIPSQSQFLLADWERVAGVIENNHQDNADDTSIDFQKRQQDVVRKLNQLGGQSRAFFIALAKALGYEITITEHKPFRLGSGCIGEPLTNGSWSYTWVVEIQTPSIKDNPPDSTAKPKQADCFLELKNVFETVKPVHTQVIFK